MREPTTLVPVETNPRFPLPAPTTLAGRRFEAADAAPGQPAELAPYVTPINTPLREHTVSARLDHNFTDTHNGSLLLQLGRSKNLRQFGGGARLADALQGRTRDTDALAYSDNFVFSPRVVNQLRAQASRLTPATKARFVGARPVVLITLDDPLPASDPANRAGTLVAGSSTAGASDRREVRWQLQDALTIVNGAHSFKFGGDLQRVRSTFIDLTDATGTYNFTSAADFLAQAPSRFRQNFNTESTQRNLYAAVFAQDEWRVRPNLMLSGGLRYERETILTCTPN
jgi:outer membrane receptor protein involved in Fe transport